jgi:hypothetical protein
LTTNINKLYFDELLFNFGLEVLLGDFLDRWGQVEGNFTHCGNKGLFDEVHSIYSL